MGPFWWVNHRTILGAYLTLVIKYNSLFLRAGLALKGQIRSQFWLLRFLMGYFNFAPATTEIASQRVESAVGHQG